MGIKVSTRTAHEMREEIKVLERQLIALKDSRNKFPRQITQEDINLARKNLAGLRKQLVEKRLEDLACKTQDTTDPKFFVNPGWKEVARNFQLALKKAKAPEFINKEKNGQSDNFYIFDYSYFAEILKSIEGLFNSAQERIEKVKNEAGKNKAKLQDSKNIVQEFEDIFYRSFDHGLNSVLKLDPERQAKGGFTAPVKFKVPGGFELSLGDQDHKAEFFEDILIPLQESARRLLAKGQEIMDLDKSPQIANERIIRRHDRGESRLNHHLSDSPNIAHANPSLKSSNETKVNHHDVFRTIKSMLAGFVKNATNAHPKALIRKLRRYRTEVYQQIRNSNNYYAAQIKSVFGLVLQHLKNQLVKNDSQFLRDEEKIEIPFLAKKGKTIVNVEVSKEPEILEIKSLTQRASEIIRSQLSKKTPA